MRRVIASNSPDNSVFLELTHFPDQINLSPTELSGGFKDGLCAYANCIRAFAYLIAINQVITRIVPHLTLMAYFLTPIDIFFKFKRSIKGDRLLLASLKEDAKTGEDFFEISDEMENLPENALFFSARMQQNIVRTQMRERITSAINRHKKNDTLDAISEDVNLPRDFLAKLKPVKIYKEGYRLYFDYMLEKFKTARESLINGVSIEDVKEQTGLSTEAVTSIQEYNDDKSIESDLETLVHWNWNYLYNNNIDDNGEDTFDL